MSHRGLATASVAFGLALAGAALLAQAPQAPHAFISVLDRNGAPVTNLDPSQVSMTLDGAACASVRLEPLNWPLKLTVLLDNGAASSEAMPTSLLAPPRNSGATDGGSAMLNALPLIREGLRRFLFEIPEGVEVSLLTLAPQPRWIVRPTAERQDFWRGIDRVAPDRGSSKFLEGLAEAADRIDREKDAAFSTIMVVTTNSSDGSGGDWQRMLDRLRSQIARRPVTVHMAVLSISEQMTTATTAGSSGGGPGTGIAPGAPVASRAQMALKASGSLQTQVGLALTKETGGRYENVVIASALLTLLPEFARRITQGYARQASQYQVSCEGAVAGTPQMSVFTTYPGARSVYVSRDGRVPN
jgi:hypothetical protein